jgi:hypothetical protein
MSSHETVNNGSAHHTRRDVERAGGGGGGRGTLESAVLASLPMASMTVTEVTTRIAIVGVVALLGLLLISRARRTNRVTQSQGSAQTSRPRTVEAAVDLINEKDIGLRTRTFGARLVALSVTSIIAGVATGIALSLVFVIGLNSLNLG